MAVADATKEAVDRSDGGGRDAGMAAGLEAAAVGATSSSESHEFVGLQQPAVEAGDEGEEAAKASSNQEDARLGWWRGLR